MKPKAPIPEISGQICWESPANIALVKYWGKHSVQLPINPSLSFVLRQSVVKICMDYKIEPKTRLQLISFSLNGHPREDFASRIQGYLSSLEPWFPFLQHAQIRIRSQSTFPHSAGIASSAAAFSALALCLCSIEAEINHNTTNGEGFLRKASFAARLGSGSACRSVYDGFAIWGNTRLLKGSSDEFAVRLDEAMVHSAFHRLKDSILIVDSRSKKVSSSDGHALMQQHPFREKRIEQANRNLEKLVLSLKTGDIKTFGEIIENEALSLHSLMMSSNPGYILMRPDTIRLLELIRDFRRETGTHLFFTLDAGPNIHVIYNENDAGKVVPFIRSELVQYCENGRWIDDSKGDGPRMLVC